MQTSKRSNTLIDIFAPRTIGNLRSIRRSCSSKDSIKLLLTIQQIHIVSIKKQEKKTRALTESDDICLTLTILFTQNHNDRRWTPHQLHTTPLSKENIHIYLQANHATQINHMKQKPHQAPIIKTNHHQKAKSKAHSTKTYNRQQICTKKILRRGSFSSCTHYFCSRAFILASSASIWACCEIYWSNNCCTVVLSSLIACIIGATRLA